LNVEHLETQFSDSCLSDAFNLIAFDIPTSGKTRAPRYATRGQGDVYDNWVEAAMIAHFCDALKIPSVHIFATMTNSVHAALRFSILFKERCLSLTLCGATQREE
jgi:pimeloyl-ACP methyl ester carboxylesterase